MSSCLSGGGRTYGFELDIVKSPSTSAQTLHTTTSSSSPSSTLSESSSSPLTISTRKPRTPRKRPNQIYNEAAALLSTAYPTIFSTKHLTKNPSKFTKKNELFYDESSVLLLPFRLIDDFGIPLPLIQEKPNFQFQFEHKVSSLTYPSITSPIEINSLMNSNSLSYCDGYLQDDDFDAESILEEEIEEGIIDSIMGNLSVNNSNNNNSSCYGCPTPMQMGLGNFGGKIELGSGIRWGLRGALRPADDGDWWRFPAVDVGQISPRITITNNNSKVSNSDAKKKKKKKKKADQTAHEQEVNEAATAAKSSNSELSEATKELIQTNAGSGLLLKLNFDYVLSAWSDRGSPFLEEIQGSDLARNDDVHARLAQIDLGLENGGVREASVLRYKEKRRTRLFSKKIRYQVRKVNADRRPRMKGRFVRRPNSNGRVVV